MVCKTKYVNVTEKKNQSIVKPRCLIIFLSIFFSVVIANFLKSVIVGIIWKIPPKYISDYFVRFRFKSLKPFATKRH